MNKAVSIVGGLVLAMTSAAIGWLARDQGLISMSNGKTTTSTAVARPPASHTKALAKLQPAAEVIQISALVGDRVVRVDVEEGESVKKGQLLVSLDSRDLRELEVRAGENQLEEARDRRDAELRLADARIAAARLQLDQTKTRTSDIEAEELKISVLDKTYLLAKNNRDRLQGLSENLVSQQEREQADLTVEKAKAELDAARMLLDKAKRSNELALAAAHADLNAALAAKEVAIASVPEQSLKAKLELAHAQLERSTLYAPCDGTVLKVHVRPGELVGPMPILEMADLGRMVAVAQVYETDVKRLQVGQRARIESRSFPEPYDRDGLTGTVERIGRMVGQPSIKELNPLAPADRRAVDVRIDLDAEASRQAQNFVNMQVDVTFLTEPP